VPGGADARTWSPGGRTVHDVLEVQWEPMLLIQHFHRIAVGVVMVKSTLLFRVLGPVDAEFPYVRPLGQIEKGRSNSQVGGVEDSAVGGVAGTLQNFKIGVDLGKLVYEHACGPAADARLARGRLPRDRGPVIEVLEVHLRPLYAGL